MAKTRKVTVCLVSLARNKAEMIGSSTSNRQYKSSTWNHTLDASDAGADGNGLHALINNLFGPQPERFGRRYVEIRKRFEVVPVRLFGGWRNIADILALGDELRERRHGKPTNQWL
jgi:hypothetical protein